MRGFTWLTLFGRIGGRLSIKIFGACEDIAP
jgi:hypothetical protein